MMLHIYLMLKSYVIKNSFKFNAFALLCILNFSCIHTSEFNQAQTFYEKLCMKYDDFSDEQVQVYYKKIKSIASTPQDEPDSWSFLHAVITENNEEIKIIPTSDGIYTYKDISFKINNSENFDFTQGVTISVMCNGIDAGDQRCPIHVETKELCLTGCKSYHDLLTSCFENKAFWRQKLILQAILRVSGHRPYKVTIESVNNKKNPILVQGMAVVYNKNIEKTEILFDFTDLSGVSIDHFDPVFKCNHQKNDIDKKIFRIQDHQLFECNSKDIFGYFDVSKNRKQWIPDETDFYDIKHQRVLACLPSCYSNHDNHPETLQDPLIWVFGNDQEHDSFYELGDVQEIENENDYIYSSGGGLLYATLRHTTKAKEYLTENHTITLDSLSPVMMPSLTVDKDIVIAGGHRPWVKGVYKRTQCVDTILWQRIEALQPSEIEQFVDKDLNKFDLDPAFVANWPHAQEKITA